MLMARGWVPVIVQRPDPCFSTSSRIPPRAASLLDFLAPAPLALGIAGDLYVATSTAAASLTLGALLALAVLSLLTCLWYGDPRVRATKAGGGCCRRPR